MKYTEHVKVVVQVSNSKWKKKIKQSNKLLGPAHNIMQCMLCKGGGLSTYVDFGSFLADLVQVLRRIMRVSPVYTHIRQYIN